MKVPIHIQAFVQSIDEQLSSAKILTDLVREWIDGLDVDEVQKMMIHDRFANDIEARQGHPECFIQYVSGFKGGGTE